MVLSGLVRIVTELAAGVFNAWNEAGLSASDSSAVLERLNYYRNFILWARPDLLEEFFQAALVKSKNNDFAQAKEIVAYLEAVFPNDTRAFWTEALVLENETAFLEKNGESEEAGERAAQAAAAYEKARTKLPKLPVLDYSAGVFFWRRKDFRQAKECFTRYAPVSEGRRREQALRCLRAIESKALDNPSYTAAYKALTENRPEIAMNEIRGFLTRFPSVWNAWFILGWALRSLGRWNDAESALKKARELGGHAVDLNNELAICLMARGDLAGAKKELENGLAREPENVKIISNLGVLAQKAGDTARAESFFRAALELAPGDVVAKAFFARHTQT
jgi:tetratricopeptide (TPR) repeat protein